MKRNTRTVVLIGLLFTISAVGANAQNGQMADAKPEEKAEMATTHHVEALNLDTDQEQKMYHINLKYIKEMETIMAGGRSRSTMMKLRDMGSRRDKEVKGVLTKDQYKEYTVMRDERKAEMKKQMRARRDNG